MLLDVLERERRKRLEAQKKVKQLMREYLSLELKRELQRPTEKLESEGRTHNHRERQRLGEGWSMNAWLAPGFSGTSNALSETFRSCSSCSRSGSRLSRLRRKAYGQTC
jgi:hypothetical protein